MTTKEDLIEEIVSNARRDRKRLEAVADGLAKNFSPPGASGEEGETFDSEIAAAFAEEIAKVSDSLTKCNQQLVELVKSDRRGSGPDDKKPTRLGQDVVEEVYDEIQPQEQVN